MCLLYTVCKNVPLKTLHFYQTCWVFKKLNTLKSANWEQGLEGDCATYRGHIFGKQILCDVSVYSWVQTIYYDV